MSAKSDYLKRFPTGWSEQVLNAADHLALACKEANPHNDSDSVSTLQLAFNELVAELWNQGFKPSDIKTALRRIETNRFISGSED